MNEDLSIVRVRRDGLRFSVSGDGRQWEVLIDADGSTRRDSVRALD